MNDFVNSSVAMVKAKVDNDIINQTLDKVSIHSKKNDDCTYGNKSMSSMYDFNKSVLSAAYEGKGAIFSGKS